MGEMEPTVHELRSFAERVSDRETCTAFRTSRGRCCLVIMYHYVRDREADRPGTATGVRGLSVAQFNSQLDRLCAAMEPIDWPALYAWTCGRRTLPNRCFLLTFDDGLADHAEVVLPILEARGLRGLFFVPGTILRENHLLPAHAVHLLLSTLNEDAFERELLDYIRLHGGPNIGDDTVDMNAALAMYHYESPQRARLKYLLTTVLPISLRSAALEAIFQEHIGSPIRWARHWYLGWDDLARMESAGHTVGAHGFSHEPYTRMTHEERREDMFKAADVLRSGLGPDIRPLSYPYGRFDGDTREACRAAGFAHAFTTERNWITRGSDIFRLPRVDTINVDKVLEEELTCTRA